jgi:hypothetical protein
VLGIGMAISVAPLTTTVMNSVTAERAGVASGVNNAVSRAAGLLAIAVLGIVMLQRFDSALESQLTNLHLAPAVARAVNDQRTRLAAIEIPESIAPETRAQIRAAVDQSFLLAFRRVMFIGATLAVLSAIAALLLIERRAARGRT